MIYTSYFAKTKNLPSDVCHISISLSTPKNWKGPKYAPLNPTWDILLKYKEDDDWENYVKSYERDVLEKQKIEDVIKVLKIIAGKKEICLMCFEKPEDNCHRHIVAKWLNENGCECKEYDFEKEAWMLLFFI